MPNNELVDFILYVLPGFIAIEIYRSAYPAKSRDKFYYITWSVLFGVLIVSLIKWLDISYLKNYLESTKDGFPSFIYIFSLLVGGTILGFIRIFIHYSRFKISQKFDCFERIAPNPQSIWAKINQPNKTD